MDHQHSSPPPPPPSSHRGCQQRLTQTPDDSLAGSVSYAQMPLRMTGGEIVELRLSVGWSQADLAQRIAYSQRQVSRWERGQQLISQEATVAILRAVVEARQSSEDTRRARYYLRRWLKEMKETGETVMSRFGLG